MIGHIWILIAKKLNGEATEEELCYLEQFFKEQGTDSPIHVLEELWEKTTPSEYPTNEALEKKWTAFEARLNIPEQPVIDTSLPEPAPRKRTLLKYLSYAAAILAFAAFFYWYRKPSDSAQGITSIAAPQSGVSKITLPDGSNVWLNAGSKINYQNNKENNSREVFLAGEAYFDVVKDPSHPFIVTTAAFKITVLGTAFNVRSYTKDPTAEATLVRGRIELVVLKNPERKYILHPAEKFTISKSTVKKTIKDSTAVKDYDEFAPVELKKIQETMVDGLPGEALWTKTVIDFDDTNFSDIALMMEHKYHVNILFKNAIIKDLKFTGRFGNESIEDALKEMQVSVKFRYKINDNQIEIY